MNKLLTLITATILLFSCSTSKVEVHNDTSLAHWKLNGNVKSVKQRYYNTDDDANGSITATYFKDKAERSPITEFYSFDSNIRRSPYMYDLEFNTSGNLHNITIFSTDFLGRDLITRASYKFLYNEQGLLTSRNLQELIKNKYQIQGEYTYRENGDFEIVQKYNTVDLTYNISDADKKAKTVLIYVIDTPWYVFANTFNDQDMCTETKIMDYNVDMTLATFKNTYDKSNRLVKTVSSYEDGDDIKEFKYDKNNNIIKETYKDDYSDPLTIEYKYENGTANFTDVMISERSQHITYEYTYDEHNNWTKVLINRTTNDGYEFNNIITREIEYYN